MKINAKKWTEDRREIETRIKALKQGIRYEDKPCKVYDYVNRRSIEGTYRGGTFEQYRDLAKLKVAATILYKIRAQFRDHQHQQKIVWYVDAFGQSTRHEAQLTKAEEREQVKNLMEEYTLPEGGLSMSDSTFNLDPDTAARALKVAEEIREAREAEVRT